MHGTLGLLIAYVLVLAAMLAALRRRQVTAGMLWQSPLGASPTLVLVALFLWVAQSILRLPAPLQSFFGLLVMIAAGYLAGVCLATRRVRDDVMAFRRGAVVSSPDAAASSGGVDPSGDATTLRLAGIAVPLADETKHFKLIGTTGTGKSTAIRELLRGALRRGDRVVIADPDGGYLARFHDPARGDVILNPFDPAARRWDLFSEILHDYDVEQLAR